MAIPLTADRGPVEFRPLSLQPKFDADGQKLLVAGKPHITIHIRVPTLYERDSFAAALVRGGVVHYSKKQIRDLMLAGVAANYPAEDFELYRSELEELWQVGDEDQRVAELQQQRLAELYDVPDGEEPPEPAKVQEELGKIVPEVTMDQRKRSRIVAVQQHLMSTYPPLQKAFADLAEQDSKRAWLQVETYVVGWKGLEHEPEGNGRGGLQKHESNYLRSQIGADAWNELSDFITALHGLDEDEEKNLASLIESMSAPIGSIPKESSAISESGDSTGGPISPIPDDGSAKMTGSSSNSTTSSGTTTE